jgi:hypothetical protein
MNHRFIAAFGSGASYTVGTSLNHHVCKSESRVRVSALCAILGRVQGRVVEHTHTHTHSFLADQVPDITEPRILVVSSDIPEPSLTNVNSSVICQRPGYG